MRITTALASQSLRTIFHFCMQMTFLARIGLQKGLAVRDRPSPFFLQKFLEIYPSLLPVWQAVTRSSKIYLGWIMQNAFRRHKLVSIRRANGHLLSVCDQRESRWPRLDWRAPTCVGGVANRTQRWKTL